MANDITAYTILLRAMSMALTNFAHFRHPGVDGEICWCSKPWGADFEKQYAEGRCFMQAQCTFARRCITQAIELGIDVQPKPGPVGHI